MQQNRFTKSYSKRYFTNSALGPNCNEYMRYLCNTCMSGPTHYVYSKHELMDESDTIFNYSLIGPRAPNTSANGIITNLHWKDDPARSPACDVNGCDIDGFLAHYAKDLQEQQPVYVSEFVTNQSRFRLFMDIDMKVAAPDHPQMITSTTTAPSTPTPLLSNRYVPALPSDFRRAMLNTIHKTVKMVLGADTISDPAADDSNTDNVFAHPAAMVVCERVPTRGKKTNSLSKIKFYYKYGMHLHWPGVVVSWKQALLIRLLLIMELNVDTSLNASIDMHQLKLFNENSDGDPWLWTAIVDEGVYGNATIAGHLRLIGSVRVVPNTVFKTPPYVPITVMDGMGNMLDALGKDIRTNIPRMIALCVINPPYNQKGRTPTCVDSVRGLLTDSEWVVTMIKRFHLDEAVVTKMLSSPNKNLLRRVDVNKTHVNKYKRQRCDDQSQSSSASQGIIGTDQRKLGHNLAASLTDLVYVTEALTEPFQNVTTLDYYKRKEAQAMKRVDPLNDTPDAFYEHVIAMFYQYHASTVSKRAWRVTGISCTRDVRFYLWTNCHYCPNHGSNHNSKTIYFFVDMVEKLVGVRCNCKCESRRGVLSQTCKAMRQIICAVPEPLHEFLVAHSDKAQERTLSQNMALLSGGKFEPPQNHQHPNYRPGAPVESAGRQPPRRPAARISPHYIENSMQQDANTLLYNKIFKSLAVRAQPPPKKERRKR